MNLHPVIGELVRLVERDALPQADVSSHWRHHGARTIVRRSGANVTLQASGFQTVHRLGPAGQILSRIERLSYLRVTRSMRSYPQIWREAASVARSLGGDRDFYVFKSACALALLADHIAGHGLRPITVMLIGDGEGLFGALLRRTLRSLTIWTVDLPKQLVFQARTYSAVEPDVAMSVGPTSYGDVRFVQPREISSIPDRIDLAVSIASMQEMDPRSVAAYFRCLRQRSGTSSRFYCVSRAQKVLPAGEVSRFAAYPWSHSDEVFVDGICPYYTRYVSRHTSTNGPRVFGVRIPFINHFDGVHLHRLARLAPSVP